MNRTFISSILIVILAFALQSFSGANSSGPEGKWRFSVPEAPYGYTNGVISIEKEAEVLNGEMRFDGIEYSFKCEDLKVNDVQISFLVFVEDTEALITLNFVQDEPDKLTGMVSYFEGEIGITAKRVTEE